MSTAPPSTIVASQYVGENLPYIVDVSQRAVSQWVAGIGIDTAELIAPTTANQTGFVYKATAAGQTGALEPAWPTTVGGTVTDGSVTWTATVPPGSGEDTVASAAWSVLPPSDGNCAISSQTTDANAAIAYLAGSVSGQTYMVQAIVTMTSGAKHIGRVLLTILA